MFVFGLIVGLVVGLVVGFVGEILLAKAISGMSWEEMDAAGEIMLEGSANRQSTIILQKDGEVLDAFTLGEK